MTQRFAVEFLSEAVEFMNSLDEKAREKIYFNIKKLDNLSRITSCSKN